MNAPFLATLRCLAVGTAFLIGATQTEVMGDAALYPKMASIDQYLMSDPDAEIRLARSAAPESISGEAEILVLGRHGYETAVKGNNGFVCLVERSWMAPMNSAEFWNPKIRGPVCYNSLALGSFLPMIHKRTQLALAGLPRTEIYDRLKSAFAAKELRPPQPGAMCYMMSKQAYLTDQGSHNMAHLMIYTPILEGAKWGADVANSPVMVGTPGSEVEPYTEFLIAVGKWSDGTSTSHSPAK
jgi:hypothetical protein